MTDLTNVTTVLTKIAEFGVQPAASVIKTKIKDPTELALLAAALGVTATFATELSAALAVTTTLNVTSNVQAK